MLGFNKKTQDASPQENTGGENKVFHFIKTHKKRCIAAVVVVAVLVSQQERNGLRLHARQRKPAMLYVMVMRVIPVHLWMVPSWKVIHIR